jgi:hypothetical protein
MPDKSLHSRHFQGPSERDVTTNNGLSTTQPTQPGRAAAVRLPGVANRRWGVDVGQFEPLAQAIHERWRQEAIANGETAPTWQDLDESRKNSSRDQARHLPVHLPKVGSALAPLRDLEARDFRSVSPCHSSVVPVGWPWLRLTAGHRRHGLFGTPAARADDVVVSHAVNAKPQWPLVTSPLRRTTRTPPCTGAPTPTR